MRLVPRLALLLFVVAVPAFGQGLFRRSDPLEITITTVLGELIRDRDSTERVMHPAELVYKDSTGKLVKVAVQLRTRGHFRRQARNCDFPPIRVEIAKAAGRNTLFQGARKLKLATSCRPTYADYEQYILQEYAVFRMFNVLSPWSYRTRLAHVSWADSLGKARPVQSWAFFVEDDGDLADRMDSKKLETKGAYFDDLEPTQMGLVQMFAWMTGNTDWSISGLHNITLLKDTTGVVRPVPFDFDWTGAVDARYAFPDRSLSIRTVRDRLWRGDCRSPLAQAVVVQQFRDRKPQLDSAVTTIPGMKPAVRDRMMKYLDEAWDEFKSPAGLASTFKRVCRDRN